MYELSPNLQGTTLSLGLTGDVTLDDVVAFNNEMREHSKTPNITQLVLNLSQVSIEVLDSRHEHSNPVSRQCGLKCSS